MIVTDNFSFVHLHKCGGTFIIDIIKKHFSSAKTIGYHLPASKIPKEYHHLPILGVIRNPFAYYVSWFTFQQTLIKPTFVWQVFSDNGSLDFNNVIERMLCIGENYKLINELIERAPLSYTNKNVNLIKDNIASIKDSKNGWFSFLFNHMYQSLPITFIHTENLRNDLYHFLRNTGVMTSELKTLIYNSPALNTTQHDKIENYYSNELKKLILLKDNTIIKRFNYSLSAI